jgi:hypothetical protein
MKKTFTLIAALCVAASAWAADIVLDLSKPVIPETLNFGDNEYINETYDETYEWFEFPPFLLKHLDGEDSSWGGYYWDGFTICKSSYNATGGLEHQWSNMAGGGVNVTADGVSVDPEKPYVIAFWSWFYEDPSLTIMFDDGNAYDVKGMYINNTPYAYYCCAEGNSFARPLNQEGDYFKVIAHGVHEDDSESTIEFELCGFHNGQFSGITDWTWWDMSELGKVVKIYFTMESTDTGDYGMNTPAYFAMDQLTVTTPDPAYYVAGGFNNWGALEITEEGATFDVVEDPADVESKEFKIKTPTADGGWNWLGGIDNNNVGYFEVTEGMMTAGTEIELYANDEAVPNYANFRLPGSGNYTITLAKSAKGLYEGVKIVVKQNNTVPTAITDVTAKTVRSIHYVNVAGQMSSKPFDGVNIMVTTYTDGTKASAKVIK